MIGKRVHLTEEGLGEEDGCWVWHQEFLYQTNFNNQMNPIYTFALRCVKGRWQLFCVAVDQNPDLWDRLVRVYVQTHAWHRVAP